MSGGLPGKLRSGVAEDDLQNPSFFAGEVSPDKHGDGRQPESPKALQVILALNFLIFN
jgi:hypothetical protein